MIYLTQYVMEEKMMKATGIVRRIDDLGRIVIPKEIRRTLHIRESDPLEIFTDREGQIILKKYSPIGEMTTFARQYAESLAQVSGHTALIADRDQFIAVAGGSKQLLNKAVSRQLEEKINNRETVIAAKGDRNYVNIAEDIAVDYAWQLITPILCEGDIIGSVILLENDGKSKMGAYLSTLTPEEMSTTFHNKILCYIFIHQSNCRLKTLNSLPFKHGNSIFNK